MSGGRGAKLAIGAKVKPTHLLDRRCSLCGERIHADRLLAVRVVPAQGRAHMEHRHSGACPITEVAA